MCLKVNMLGEKVLKTSRALVTNLRLEDARVRPEAMSITYLLSGRTMTLTGREWYWIRIAGTKNADSSAVLFESRSAPRKSRACASRFTGPASAAMILNVPSQMPHTTAPQPALATERGHRDVIEAEPSVKMTKESKESLSAAIGR